MPDGITVRHVRFDGHAMVLTSTFDGRERSSASRSAASSSK
jgi:hypothetical protein